MFLQPKQFIFECRPNFESFCPLPGPLKAILFSAPNPSPSQISAYATGCDKHRTDDQHGLGSKPTYAILLCP